MKKMFLLALALPVGMTAATAPALSQTAAAHQTEQARPAPARRATPSRATQQRRRPEATRTTQRRQPAAQQGARPVRHRATRSEVMEWRNYGADPAYRSREAAIADAHNVFVRGGWSEDVARQMQQKMQTEACERFELQVGDRLDTMRSGASELWRNVLVNFQQPRNMRLTAPACRWTITVGGVTYTAVIPDVCFNLATLRVGMDCVVVNFTTWRTDETEVDWQRRGRATDECFAVRRVGSLFESVHSNTPWIPIRAGGREDPCTFCEYNRTFGYRGVAEGTIYGLTPGVYQIRIARDEPIDLCLKRIFGTNYTSSFTNGVNWPAAYTQMRSEYHARVFYHSGEMEAAGFQAGQPKGLPFWPADGPAEARIRASFEHGASR